MLIDLNCINYDYVFSLLKIKVVTKFSTFLNGLYVCVYTFISMYMLCVYIFKYVYQHWCHQHKKKWNATS
jgi:hypothetical protein